MSLIYILISASDTSATIFIARDQVEQRKELVTLLRKYGEAWEPWKKELEKFKGGGRELITGKDY